MNRTKVKCEICGKEISKSNIAKHLKSHETHPEYHDLNKGKYALNHDGLTCQFCGKEYKNRNSLCTHERQCKENPNRQESAFVRYNKEKGHAWNKGLTKETDDRVAKQAKTLSESIKGKPGHKHTEASKQKISTARKRYLSEHPDRVPYLINHSSKISYPEQYFIDLFVAEHIDLKYHLQFSKYELDFYNEEKKIDVEIDGEQHYLDKRIYQSDRDRDKFMSDNGWTVKRIRWSDYKKLTIEEKSKIINDIKLLL